MNIYENLSNYTRRAVALSLNVILFGLIVADKIVTFWGGMIGGLLVACLLQEFVMYLRRRKAEQS